MKFTVFLLLSLCFTFTLLGEAYFLDLSKAATVSYEDDGIADNGKGGWSDEGVNDMYIFPPVKLGENYRNGYKFEIIDPSENDGKNVIMLKGSERGKGLPDEVTVKVTDKKGKYIYFIQNSVGNVKKPKNYLQAVYTVKYSDGSEEEIKMHHGRELRHWWTGNWWDNSGAAAWPVFMGQNHYAKKWSQYIGLWATQWENPHPKKSISSITFKSEGKANPAIFAVTIADENFNKSDDIKKHFKRPAAVPKGYFAEKLKKEQELLFKELIAEKHARGIRSVKMFTPSLLSVTIDCSIIGGAGMGEKKAAELQKSAKFAITSKDDSNYADSEEAEKVGRKSLNFNTVSTNSFPNNQLYMHTYYLRLPKAMKNGSKYKITVSALDKKFKRDVEITYNQKKTPTPAIKINQAGYSGTSKKRYAYLGWWAADLGAVDYSRYKNFNVVDAENKKTVLRGKITPRRKSDEKGYDWIEKDVSGEDVYEMDISKLGSGNYYIQIPGLGRSDLFSVGKKGLKNIYRTVMRGFLHQRCGCELTKDFTDFPRKASYLRNYKNGHLVKEGDKITDKDKVKEFRGGYHDAGDTDVFYSHMMANYKMLLAYELAPKAFSDKELNIPESGNGLPDILDEAAWGLKFFYDTQKKNGAVYAGRANDQDYSYKAWKNEFKKWKKENPEWRKYGDLPPYGNFFPCVSSSNTFATVAAYYSKAIRPFDEKKAEKYLKKAEKAYEWAQKHNKSGYEKAGISYGRYGWKTTTMWAAAVFFNITGKEKYSDKFVKLYKESLSDKEKYDKNRNKGSKKEKNKLTYDYSVAWGNLYGEDIFILYPYIASNYPNVNKKIQKKITKRIVESADKKYEYTMERHAYRLGHFRERGYWGQLSGGGVTGNNLLIAYLITGKQKYLNAASLNADFQLGTNPLSRTFITGLGHRPPLHPQLHDWLYNGVDKPSRGVPVYGITSTSLKKLGNIYPKEIPGWRRWLDNRTKSMYSEFDVASQMANHAFFYCTLWALEHKK